MLEIVDSDGWLRPYEHVIEYRHSYIQKQKERLINAGGKSEFKSLSDIASGYLYFGLHNTGKEWILREWLPNATAVYLIGDFNRWQKDEKYIMQKMDHGQWEITLPIDSLHHLDLYKLIVQWDGGEGERIPAWATRVVQDSKTHIFSAQVWHPQKPYKTIYKNPEPDTHPLLVYECHIGMSGESEGVTSFNEFRLEILPRIKELGYNTIQIMGIQEHPYYGSFGYHVSSFFAVSSRFGTPDELKQLIDDAHSMGIAVIMDIVHSHAVKNQLEGIGYLDGTSNLYTKGDHPLWDSLLFDYGKQEVLHFLLSNCKFWLEEYQFDGFRFDGVTSMLFYHHGINKDFVCYNDYYDGQQDIDAITYLTLANELIHEVKPHAITIAEDMSGMPGLALPVNKGGYGFDYRMALNIPDYWIKIIKEKTDEEWDVGSIYWELTNRRFGEKTISYAESHDQALVGDKTIIFRLIDADMYWHMSKFGPSTIRTDRGLALHKMIRLITLSTINGGYLTFMGNEFGHPEWIDFPREGNNWSYAYARRQWHLQEDKTLKYHYLSDFDRDMIHLIKTVNEFEQTYILKIWESPSEKIIMFMRANLLFAFNFNASHSFSDYKILTAQGKYKIVLSSDAPEYGGNNLVDTEMEYLTEADPLYEGENKGWLRLYLPARTALVLMKID